MILQAVAVLPRDDIDEPVNVADVFLIESFVAGVGGNAVENE